MDLANTGTLAGPGPDWSGWLGANALVREIASCHLHHGIDWAAFERALVISPRNSFLSLIILSLSQLSLMSLLWSLTALET